MHPSPPSADEVGEPTLLVVVVVTLFAVVGAVWLLGAVSATWALALAALVELVGLLALVSTLLWQLSDGAGRRERDR